MLAILSNSGYDPEDIRVLQSLAWERSRSNTAWSAPGNHDRYFQNFPQEARSLLTNAIYLENAGVTIDDVTFWGHPTPLSS